VYSAYGILVYQTWKVDVQFNLGYFTQSFWCFSLSSIYYKSSAV